MRNLTDGQRSLTLRLTPPELGTVRIEIVEQAGRLSVRLGAEDDSVRAQPLNERCQTCAANFALALHRLTKFASPTATLVSIAVAMTTLDTAKPVTTASVATPNLERAFSLEGDTSPEPIAAREDVQLGGTVDDDAVNALA